jgi:hypothetical protein
MTQALSHNLKFLIDFNDGEVEGLVFGVYLPMILCGMKKNVVGLKYVKLCTYRPTQNYVTIL